MIKNAFFMNVENFYKTFSVFGGAPLNAFKLTKTFFLQKFY